jgi:hypothetical protein
MGRKVEVMIARGADGIDLALLETYKANLAKRVMQVDRGVFKWSIIHAKKLTVKELARSGDKLFDSVS